MKIFVFACVMIVLSTFLMIFQFEYNNHARHMEKLKYVAEEAAAAATQYYDLPQYSEGKIIFNQSEGTKAADYVIKRNLKLSSSLQPTVSTYWKGPISYKIEFFDDSTGYPATFYTSDDTGESFILNEPSAVVTISAGEARYTKFFSNNNIRLASHTWQGR
jgi:hypothetical protein